MGGGLPKHRCGHNIKKGEFGSSSELEGDLRREHQTSAVAAILTYILRSAETGVHTSGSLISCQGQGQGCENKELADIGGKGSASYPEVPMPLTLLTQDLTMSLLGKPPDLGHAQAVSKGMPVLHSSLDVLPTATLCGSKPTRRIFCYW